MKDKCFIYYGNPCIICLADPAIQSFEDAGGAGASRASSTRSGAGARHLRSAASS